MNVLTLFLPGTGLYKKRKELLPFLSGCQKITFNKLSKSIVAVIGWGANQASVKARHYASKHGHEFWCLEDGFISYLGHPAEKNYARLSLIIDKTGIYYDATRTNDLEKLILNMKWCNQNYLEQARKLINKVQAYHITKYNFYMNNNMPASVAQKMISSNQKKVLVVDQTQGDLSVLYGKGDTDCFECMLKAAIDENPDSKIIIRTHPDVILGVKKGYFTKVPEYCTVVHEQVNPFLLLQQVDKVYTVSSQLGFEALIAGREVICFGVPFYAGWGLTDDRASVSGRGKKRSLEQVFAAAYMKYPRYINPITKTACDLEEIINFVHAQKKYTPYYTQMYALGFSKWKRKYIKPFAQKVAGRLIHVSEPRTTYQEPLLVWGARSEELIRAGHKVYCVEDGFLRSFGLGCNHIKPYSLIIDDRGIYYQPARPSMLEDYLNSHVFTQQELEIGQEIINKLTGFALSKYNVGKSVSVGFKMQSGDRKVILIPGQVSDDASVVYGSPFLKGNSALIQKVRELEPEAFIVYKVHPDVVASKREGTVSSEHLSRYADLTVGNLDIIDCFKECDEVHTLTSLTGMEALMHGIPVTVWGQPFYAGWGLTTDNYPVKRRKRNLSLSALVYAAYAWYPLYYDWESGFFCEAIHIINKIYQEKQRHLARMHNHFRLQNR